MSYKTIVLAMLSLFAADCVTAQTEDDVVDSEHPADLCEIFEIESTTTGANLKCLAFIPAKMVKKKPKAALIVLPERADTVNRLAQIWADGDVPDQNSMIIVVPDIDPRLAKETAFALFSEVMQVVSVRYTIDPARLGVWGIDAAARHAFFAARALPDKFAALVGPDRDIFADSGLFGFSILPANLQVAKVKTDPATYRPNLDGIGIASAVELPKKVTEMDPDEWARVCRLVNAAFSRKDPDAMKAVFRTDRLRFSKYGNYRILSFRNWSLPSELNCRGIRADDESATMEFATANIEMLSIAVAEGVERIRIDGDLITVDSGDTITLQRRGRRWRRIEPPAVVVNRKNPDSAGPLSDALLTPYVFVVGTQGDNSAALQTWAEQTASSMARADIRILTDVEVMNDEDLKREHTLVCFGTAEDNLVVDALPKRELPGEDLNSDRRSGTIHTYLQPSPFAIDRYVVVNTAEEVGAGAHPARLDWPTDWVRYPAGNKPAVALGCFDRDWRPEELPEDPWAMFRSA